MTKKKKKEVSPDDYFSNGLFEIARFGKNIILHNMMTPEIHEQYLKTIANGYEESIIRIDTIVQNIRSKVSKCNPEMSMNFIFVWGAKTYIENPDEDQQILEYIIQSQLFYWVRGQGFAFVGRQAHLEVGGDDFYIALLFYHLKLRCCVVIELKDCDFEPGFISQLNM